MTGALALFANGGATRGKVAAAFREVHADEPLIVGKTRAKFGAERAERQRVVIALSKARAAGARIPRKMDGGALAAYAHGGPVNYLGAPIPTTRYGMDVQRRITAGRFQDGGPVEFSAGRAEFVPQWRDPSIGFTPKDLLFAGAGAGGLGTAGLRNLIKQIAQRKAMKEAALLAADPVERLFAEAAKKIPGFAGGGPMSSADFPNVTSPRAPAQEPELRAMTARLRRPLARPTADADAQVRAVLAELVGEEAAV